MDMKQKSLVKSLKDYNPDSFDLITDDAARQYWFNAIEKLIEKFVAESELLNPNGQNTVDRAKKCLESFRRDIKLIAEDISSYKELSIRYLLEINEKFLQENGFEDAWKFRKTTENKCALICFEKRLNEIDSIPSHYDRWFNLIQGILAGNMFDWGAKNIIDILESNKHFNFQNAISKIEYRPWLYDDFDAWAAKIKNSKYKCVICFPDNSGYDIILGILPVVREFLKSGTTVILSANKKPAINDVTHDELIELLQEIRKECNVFNIAIKENRLICLHNGSSSPCLDLRTLNPAINKYLDQIDLVLIEGMGRAIHTNFYVKFRVDCLKLAVIKNDWIAKRLDGTKFSVICKFEPASK